MINFRSKMLMCAFTVGVHRIILLFLVSCLMVACQTPSGSRSAMDARLRGVEAQYKRLCASRGEINASSAAAFNGAWKDRMTLFARSQKWNEECRNFIENAKNVYEGISKQERREHLLKLVQREGYEPSFEPLYFWGLTDADLAPYLAAKKGQSPPIKLQNSAAYSADVAPETRAVTEARIQAAEAQYKSLCIAQREINASVDFASKTGTREARMALKIRSQEFDKKRRDFIESAKIAYSELPKQECRERLLKLVQREGYLPVVESVFSEGLTKADLAPYLAAKTTQLPPIKLPVPPASAAFKLPAEKP